MDSQLKLELQLVELQNIKNWVRTEQINFIKWMELRDEVAKKIREILDSEEYLVGK